MIVGMSDGLTVSFSVAAGRCALALAKRIALVGGLAELGAGSIFMRIRGELACQTPATTAGNSGRQGHRKVKHQGNAVTGS
ncbi:VIT1/CCC1 transporter family protein [Microcoleus sp. A006_D1]|uniref:VIT1/CCC1 transporter family protein n=1 Tax=Microcoleus sp. A006_D1 TaxID=3055267 RepID=UPI003FA53F6B